MSLKIKYLFSFLCLSVCETTAVFSQEKPEIFRNVESSFTYTTDVFANVAGGAKQGIRGLDNVDVDLSFDVNDFTFYIYGLGNQGRSISELTGDIQGVSNIEAENSWRFYEAWVQKVFPSINSSVLIGLYDLNSEFDVVANGMLFMNSSHGIGPDFSASGVLGPSIFPITSLSARAKIIPKPGITIKLAVLDAVPSNPVNTQGTQIYLRKSEGALFVSEVAFTNPNTTNEGQYLERGIDEDSPYRVVIGGWKYSKERIGWEGNLESDHGLYAIGEMKVSKKMATFARVGITHHKLSRFHSYVGAGLTYTGLLKGREQDEAGFAIALPLNGDDFIEFESNRGFDYSQSELNVELTYLAPISNHVSFQFNTQYIINPNRHPSFKNSLAIGLRSVFSF